MKERKGALITFSFGRKREVILCGPSRPRVKKRPGPKEGRLFTEVEGLSDNLRFDDSM